MQPEYPGKFDGDDLFQFDPGRNPAALLPDGGHDARWKSARSDDAKCVEIEVYVKREAVKGHPAPHCDADGSDLAIFYPYSGGTLHTPPLQAKPAQGPNQALLQVAKILPNGRPCRSPPIRTRLRQSLKVKDWIAQKLSGAMIGRPAAAVGANYRRSFVPEASFIQYQVIVILQRLSRYNSDSSGI